MSSPEPRFPYWVDSTALAAFKRCEKQFYWSQILRLTTDEINPHFNAGGAYAHAHEHTRNLIYGPKRVPVDEAVASGLLVLIREYGDFDPNESMPPSAQAKTWLGMSDAFIRFYQRWHPEFDWLMPDMRRWIDPNEGDAWYLPSNEFSFAVPLPFSHPETGDPILFCGRSDMQARLGGQGCWPEYRKDPSRLHEWPLYIFDDKTTWQMGRTWAAQWTFRGQFIGYVWAHNQLAHEPHERAHGAVVCGAGIQKTQTKTDRAIVEIPQWKVDSWYDTTCHTLDRMLSSWHSGQWAKAWDDACTSYGGCPFQQLCDTPRPEPWMANYTESTWNPVAVPHKED